MAAQDMRGTVREFLLQELPRLLQEDASLRLLLWQILQPYVAGRAETESRFEQLLAMLQKQWEEDRRKWEEHLRRWDEERAKWEERWEENQRRWEEHLRQWEEERRTWEERWEENQRRWEENQRKWEENQRRWEENQRKWEENQRRWEENQRRWEENQRKWEENQRRWEENQRKWEENQRRWEENQRKWEENQRRWEENQKIIRHLLEEIKRLDRRIDTSLGALGARWGLHAESAFRNALAGILEEVAPGVQVIRTVEKDPQGEVFGRPDQIELDLIIKDGDLILGEIKSSMSKADVYIFERKARFYEKKHNRKAKRLVIISPMVEPKAREVADELGIKVYTHAEEAAAEI